MIDLKQFINEWKSKLSIESERIEWIDLPFSHFDNEEHNYSKVQVSYYYEKGFWLITYEETVKPYAFIHELGHIYLWKLTNHLDIIKSRKLIINKNPITTKINHLENVLLDCFVNYNLYEFEEFKKLFLFECIDNLNRIYHFNNNQLDKILQFYIYWYIIYNFIIEKEVKDHYEKQIKDVLKPFKKEIMRKSSFNQKFFLRLNAKLNKFNQIKETKKIRTIINFIYEVLGIFPYWSKTQLLEQLNLIFHLKEV